MSKKVEWTNRAKASLDYFCDIIGKDSLSNARKVRKEIVLVSKKLSKNPYLFQIDEYYPDNPGNIRRYFKWSYRIVYQVSDEKITVLNVYHTGTDPNQDI